MPITDEDLMQYADGTLRGDAAQRVADALAHDATLRDRLSIFTQTGRVLAEPYQDIVNAPVPPRLFEAVMTGGAPAAAQRVRPPADPFAGVKGFLDNLFSFGRPRFAPAFATALLALGGVVGWQLHRVSDAPGAAALPLVVDNGQIRAQGALASALETAPAGLVVKTSASDPAITVRLTFKSKAQAFCRQYEIDAGGGAAFAGIACRAASGHWQISYHTPMAASPTSQTQVTPVSDAKAQLGALVDAMSSGDPLDAEEEARVRKEHWR